MAKKTLIFVAIFCFLPITLLAFQPRILTLSGRVVQEDGTPPPPPIQVELACNSRVIQVAQTRAEGSFHFRLGEERRASDLSASTSGPDSLEVGNRGLGGLQAGGGLRTSGDGRYDLTNCEIRLSPRPGWQGDRILLGIQSIFEPDVGTIVLRELADVAGTTVSVTSLEAPEPAVEAYRRAGKELDKKKPNYKQAAKRLEEAVALFPNYAEAWNLLGEARIGLGDIEGAREALQRAVAADPNYILPYHTLAAMELEKFRWKEALTFTSKLVELYPGGAQGHYYHGLAHYSLGEYDDAMKSFLVIEKGGDGQKFPQSVLMLGDILARKGQILESAKRLRRYLEIGQHSPQMGEQLRGQLKQWEEKGLIERPSAQPPGSP